jgi:hypothetical protein
MMIDWWAILIPLPIALIALFFLFLGCAHFDAAPPAPAGTTPNQTTFQFNPDTDPTDDVSKVPPGVPPAQAGQLSNLIVTFTLTDSMNPSTPSLTHTSNIPPPYNSGNPAALFKFDVGDATLGTRNLVVCDCTIVLTVPNLMMKVSTTPITLIKDAINKFVLENAPQANPKSPMRKFQIVFNP